MLYSKCWNIETTSQEYSLYQSYPSDMKRNKGFPRKTRAEGIYCHKTYITRNVRDLLPETKRQKAHKTLSKMTNRENCNSISEYGVKQLLQR